MPQFTHLHCHTQYSLLDGQASISGLMKKAAADGMTAVALTDHGNMFGAFNFVAEATKNGIKPIVGCEFYLVEDRHQKSFSKEQRDNRYHQLLLAKDQEGYQNLAKLCSLGYIDGLYSKWPRIDKELLQQYSKGLIATSCCIGAELPQAILWKSEEEAESMLKWWLDLFGEDYYIEIQRHGLMNIDGTGKSQEDINQTLLRWAKKYNIRTIATNDSHYIDQGDFNAHDILLCVNTGEDKATPVGDFNTKYYRLLTDTGGVIYDHLDNIRKQYGLMPEIRQGIQRIEEAGPKTRFGFPNDQFYFKTQAEMNALFADVPEAIDFTQEIVDKITPPKLQRDILLPNFPMPAGFTNADQYLRHLTFEGAKKRYGDITPEIEERLNFELHVIETMGFAGYFLIVQDFINHGRHIGVGVGPGRGSAAGSAVAFCVGITNIDPIKYSLLFERFLNPERVSMPDIDIDFDDVGRQRVIDYVVDKYGKTQVAQIITFGTMAAKSSIKDVARALELSLPETNEITKMVPDAPGTTLAGAFKDVPELQRLREGDDLKGTVLRLAEQLEGSVRNTGIHAAGIIIAPDDITQYIPVSTSKDSDLLVTQFDGKVIESAGMLKMDFLGLKTLTIIKDALTLIKKNHGVDIDIDTIPLDDEKTYALYQRGDTIGTFQFESEGMRMYLKDLKPTNIEDLIAMNALYRPGPMQFIPNFINRKHGKEQVEYPHELLEPILNYSYGIMVYQEQIMQTAQILAGYTLGGADMLRRAMGKKDMKKMAQEREKFVAGAKQLHNIPKAKAEEVFDVMEKFAQYGFNRCLTGDTRITDVTTGCVYTMEELYRLRPALQVHALAENGKLRSRPVTDYIYNGEKPVFELRTRQGKVIRATGNHPFRTLSGWTLLQDLREGDRIAAPRHLTIAATRTWDSYKLIALAGLISEGNTCHPSCLYFFSNDYAQIEDFASAIGQFPDTVARIYSRPDKRYEVCASTGNKPSFGTPQTGPTRSGAFTWAGELGLLGKKATEKFVPKEIFEISDKCLELFVGRLWAGDGFIANQKERSPFYATSSARLATDVQMLLLRLGIQSGIHTKTFKYRGSHRTGYTVKLIGEDSAELFLSRIAPHALGREAAVALLADYLRNTGRGLTSKDTVPAQVRELVNAGRQAAGLTWKGLEEKSGYSMREFTGNGSQVKQAFRRGTLAGVARTLACDELLQIAESDIFWDQIISITPAGTEPTYDITVEDDHNFVANGLIVHNSHSAAYSVVAYQTGYLKAHYPGEYMASVLTHNMNDIKKITFFIEEAKRQGVPVLGPDVNESGAQFDVNREGKIRFGMAAIKGTGEAAVEAILDERYKKGPYQDLFDFAKRVNLRAVNKKTFESLAQAGGFDNLSAIDRAAYLEVPEGETQNLLEKAIRFGNAWQQEQLNAQQSLFGGGGGMTLPLPKVVEVKPYTPTEKLRKEKEVVGFYISGHPLDQFHLEMESFCTCPIDQLENYKGRDVSIAGIVSSVVERQGKNGNPFILFTVEDYDSTLNLAVFGDDVVKFRNFLKTDYFLYIKGKMQLRYKTEDQWELKPTHMDFLGNIAEKQAKGVTVTVDLQHLSPALIAELELAAQTAVGQRTLQMLFIDNEERLSLEMFSRKYRVEPKSFIEKIRGLESVEVKLMC